jgi:uridine kinase
MGLGPDAAPTPGTGGNGQRRLVLGRVAHEVLSRAEPSRPTRVAVDGITAVGKTTFADDLATLLRGIDARVLRVTMDGFHNPRAVRYRQGRGSAAGYYEDAYDLVGLRSGLLDPLGPGGDRRYRTAVWDLHEDRPAGGAPSVAPDDLVLVVDGSFLQKPEVRDGWDVVVHLWCPFDAAERRGVARDAAALGGEAAARDLFRGRYHAAQRRYLDEVDPVSRADIVVDHRDPQRPTLR